MNERIVREVRSGRKPLQRVYVGFFLWFTGRAIVAASKVDQQVREDFAALPDDFAFALGVLPGGPWMVVGKEKGRVKYLGSNPECRQLHLRLAFKNIEAAMLLLTFRESSNLATARNRLITDGELPYALAVNRIMDIVEVYLLAKMIAKHAVKRYPVGWSIGRKYGGRIGVYVRVLLGL